MYIGCPPHTLQIFSRDKTNSKQWFVVRGDIWWPGDPLKKKEKRKKKKKALGTSTKTFTSL
jgi:hypothetical protein